MCVLQSWKFGHDYVKNITKQARPGRGRFQVSQGRDYLNLKRQLLYEPQDRRGRGRGKGKGQKGAFMKMLMVAHCETANDNDERFVILFFMDS